MKKLSGSLLLAFMAGCLFAASPVTIIENGPDPRRKTLLTVLTMPDGHLVIETNRYIYAITGPNPRFDREWRDADSNPAADSPGAARAELAKQGHPNSWVTVVTHTTLTNGAVLGRTNSFKWKSHVPHSWQGEWQEARTGSNAFSLLQNESTMIGPYLKRENRVTVTIFPEKGQPYTNSYRCSTEPITNRLAHSMFPGGLNQGESQSASPLAWDATGLLFDHPDSPAASMEAGLRGWLNIEEYFNTTNALSADWDGDGISNWAEANVYHTSPFLADSDGGGLTDAEEIAWGTNPWAVDSDGGGLTDEMEIFVSLTDPTIADELTVGDGFGPGFAPSTVLSAFMSSDGDSLDDAWENYFFGGLGYTDSSDPDSDGRSNLTEFNAGTDPTVPDNGTFSTSPNEFVWVEDSVPSLYLYSVDDPWTWRASSPTPVSGNLYHVSSSLSTWHQHYFNVADTRLSPVSGDKLFAWIYIPPDDVPQEIMLQWQTDDATEWNHRAYWGADNLPWGARTNVAGMPDSGQWVRLEVDAGTVDLVGRSVHGMAFTLAGGSAFWDRAGIELSSTANIAPRINAPASASTTKNQPVYLNLVIIDSDAASGSEMAVLYVAHGSLTLSGTAGVGVWLNADGSMGLMGALSDLNNSIQNLQYTPTTDYVGSDELRIFVNDLGHTGAGGAQTIRRSVPITISAGNQPPTAVNDVYSTTKNVQLNVSSPGVLSNDSDPESNPLTAIKVTNPGNGTVTLNPNGSFTYTPNTGYIGTDSFTYKANDGTSDSGTATVSITVVDPPPPASDYNVSRDFGKFSNPYGVWSYGWKQALSGSFSLLPNLQPSTFENGVQVTCWDVAYNTQPAVYCNTSTSEGRGAGGLLVLPPGAVWSAVGTADPYNYVVIRFTAPSTASYTVAATYDPVYSGQYQGDVHYHIVKNGVEQPGGANVPAYSSASYNATFALNAGDTVDFANDRGADNNEYGSQLRMSIVITPSGTANTPPTANPQSVTTGEDSSATITLSGADAETPPASLSFNITTAPTFGTVARTGANVTYTPFANYNGSDSFGFKVIDAGTPPLQSAEATVSITVTPVNDQPVANPDSYTTPKNTPLVVSAPGVLANDTDLDGDSLQVRYVIGSGPNNGVLSTLADGSITYTPNPEFVGADSYSYKAFDGVTESAATTVSIRVTAFPPVRTAYWSFDCSLLNPPNCPLISDSGLSPSVISDVTLKQTQRSVGAVRVGLTAGGGLNYVWPATGSMPPIADHNLGSVCLWFHPEWLTGQGASTFNILKINGPDGMLRLEITTDGAGLSKLICFENSTIVCQGTITWPTASWHQIALTYSTAEGTKLFVDGALLATGSAVQYFANSSTDVFIGGDGSGTGAGGWLDEVEFYNYVLPLSTINTRYVAVLNRDLDGDGIPDLVEEFNGTDPGDPSDPAPAPTFPPVDPNNPPVILLLEPLNAQPLN